MDICSQCRWFWQLTVKHFLLTKMVDKNNVKIPKLRYIIFHCTGELIAYLLCDIVEPVPH